MFLEIFFFFFFFEKKHKPTTHTGNGDKGIISHNLPIIIVNITEQLLINHSMKVLILFS